MTKEKKERYERTSLSKAIKDSLHMSDLIKQLQKDNPDLYDEEIVKKKGAILKVPKTFNKDDVEKHIKHALRELVVCKKIDNTLSEKYKVDFSADQICDKFVHDMFDINIVAKKNSNCISIEIQ